MPRTHRMISPDTSKKAWAAFESALRAQNLVVVHSNKLLILDIYEAVLSAHSAAHPRRQAGCPTCAAYAELGGKENSDA